MLGTEDQILLLCDVEDPVAALPFFAQDSLEPLCELLCHYRLYTVTHKRLNFYLWCHIPVLDACVQDCLYEFADEFLYYVVVLRVSFLGSADEFVDELQCHIFVLRVSFLDSPDEFFGEILCHLAVLLVFFLDYLDKFIDELLYYVVVPVLSFWIIHTNSSSSGIPAPSGA